MIGLPAKFLVSSTGQVTFRKIPFNKKSVSCRHCLSSGDIKILGRRIYRHNTASSHTDYTAGDYINIVSI